MTVHACVQVRWQPNDVLASLAQVLTNLAVDPSFAKVRARAPYCYSSQVEKFGFFGSNFQRLH